MKNETLKLLKELLNDFKKGTITIKATDGGDWLYYCRLKANISNKIDSGDDVPVLKISNLDNTVSLLEKYLEVAKIFYQKEKDKYDINDQSLNKKILFGLIVNANNYDLNNFEQYVVNKTKMISENKMHNIEKEIETPLGKSILKVEIEKNDSKLEGPYKFNTTISNGSEQFTLPSIVFGQIENKVVVYTIQGKKNREENATAKKLDRYFRKFNKNIDQNEIEGKVSPNALAALTIFLSYMENAGIKEIEAPVFLPLRYISYSLLNKERLDENQFNMTNRFAYTLFRYYNHFENCEFYYDDSSEKCYLKLNKGNSKKDDNVIYAFKEEIKKGLR